MKTNETIETVSSRSLDESVNLLYGLPATTTPLTGLQRAFAGQAIDPKPLPKIRTREEKARDLVVAGAVQLPDQHVEQILWDLGHGGAVVVRSQTDPTRGYAVNGHCSCPDYLRHVEENPKHQCKHRLALKYALLARWHAEEDLLNEFHPGDPSWPHYLERESTPWEPEPDTEPRATDYSSPFAWGEC